VADASKVMNKDAIKEHLKGLATETHVKVIQKPVTDYDQCLNICGDYAEKELMVCNNDTLI
jgi:hypothetical protein